MARDGLIVFHDHRTWAATVSARSGWDPNTSATSLAPENDSIGYCISLVREHRPKSFVLDMQGSVNGGVDDGLIMKVNMSKEALRRVPLLWDIFNVCPCATSAVR